jgi:tRNA A-37 threonylcarbamoyl transferase component Bud32
VSESPPPSSLRDELQATLGSAYTLERELGGGGMSRVFVADETSLGRKVVVKVLPPELAAAVNVERFRREIQLAARLQHPHIVPLLAAGISNGLPYYTMPFVTGESLRARLARTGELPIPDTVRILRDVLSALSYAHEQGVVHRDIKPDNVLLTKHHAQVTDFGVAKALSAATNPGTALTSLGVALGTPAYMAPEQAAGDPSTDHRADLYAVAAMGYEMLTGYKVFSERSPQQMLAAHAIETPEPIAKRRQATPPALAAVIMGGLEKRPADRPQSADEMLAALDAVSTPMNAAVSDPRIGHADTSASGIVASPPASRFSGRRGLIGGAALALIAIAIVVGLLLRGRPSSAGVDRNLVVVAPFRVAGAQPSLGYLREGMLDLLAAKLTGEGGPRAADPRAVLSAWKKIAESDVDDLSQNETVKLAANLGAGQVILGGIVGTPARMVVSAAVYEVPSGRSLRGDVTVQGPADSLASLVDQLTIQLLSLQSGEDRQHLGELASASLPALREYLDGKVLYRHGRYTLATEHFNRAVEIDSTFALAAVALAASANWIDSPLRLKGMRLGWAAKQKLTARDQAFLLGQSGSDLSRPPTGRETLAAR